MKFILFYISFIPTFLFANGASKDSNDIAKNTIYMDFFGNGGIYSINFDRIFFENKHLNFFGSIGVAVVPYKFFGSTNVKFIYPLEVGASYGRKGKIDVAFGFTSMTSVYADDIFKRYDSYYIPTISLGYRFQKPSGGVFFRIRLLGYLLTSEFSRNYSNYGNNRSWLGLGIGYVL